MATVFGYPTSFATSSTPFYSSKDYTNMCKDDSTYATYICAKSNTKSKGYLNGFSLTEKVPANATITAMQMEYKISKQSNVNSTKLTTFRCFNGSSTTKTGEVNVDLNCNGSANSVNIPLPFAWTPDEVNSNCISIAIQATGSGSPSSISTGNNRLQIYYMRIVVEYKLAPYNVKFNGNGATSGSMTNQSIDVDIATKLTKNIFKKQYTVTLNDGSSTTTKTSSATFQGWATSASGSKVYNDEQSVTNIASSGATINLYAKWSTMSAVTFLTPTLEGYTFLGWYTAAEGGSKVGDGGASYTPTGNITLYAHWEQAIKPPRFTSAEMIYGGEQVSPTNKVIAKEGFRIIVGVEFG